MYIHATRRVIRVKFISICRGGSRRSSTSPSTSPPQPGRETERMEIPPHPPRAGRHGTDFPRPRVSLLVFVSRPGRVRLHTQRGRGSRDEGRGDWPADGWGKPGNGVIIGRGDLLDRTSSKLRRIDRINLPPRRNIEGEKARGGGCGLTRRRTRHKYDLAGPRSTNWELFGRNRDG